MKENENIIRERAIETLKGVAIEINRVPYSIFREYVEDPTVETPLKVVDAQYVIGCWGWTEKEWEEAKTLELVEEICPAK